jgi:hypothetical protein
MEFSKDYDIHKDPRMINCRTQCGNTECRYKNYECWAEKTCSNYKPPLMLTRADEIRAMDDDALANLLAQTSLEAANMEESEELKGKMTALWIDWLKQDATKGGV